MLNNVVTDSTRTLVIDIPFKIGPAYKQVIGFQLLHLLNNHFAWFARFAFLVRAISKPFLTDFIRKYYLEFFEDIIPDNILQLISGTYN